MPKLDKSNEEFLAELQAVARERGGTCLSTEYVNAKTKMLWRCKKGHEWEATSHTVKNKKRWCRRCFHEGQHLDFEELKQAVLLRGIECLSTEYVNTRTELWWRCKNGHRWPATPACIKKAGCRICSAKANGAARKGTVGNSTVKLNLEEMQAIAREHEGECISSEYVNIRTELWWRCKNGHEWPATPQSIKLSGTWCPTCFNENRRLRLEEMEEIARQRGGECISSEYVSSEVDLWWRCKNGHTWQATPANVKDYANSPGSWCPTCAHDAQRREQ